MSGPRKSILKRTNSQTFREGSVPPQITPYSTVTGAEGGKIRQAIGAIVRKSSTIFDVASFQFANGGSTPTSPTSGKKVTLVILVHPIFMLS